MLQNIHIRALPVLEAVDWQIKDLITLIRLVFFSVCEIENESLQDLSKQVYTPKKSVWVRGVYKHHKPYQDWMTSYKDFKGSILD